MSVSFLSDNKDLELVREECFEKPLIHVNKSKNTNLSKCLAPKANAQIRMKIFTPQTKINSRIMSPQNINN